MPEFNSKLDHAILLSDGKPRKTNLLNFLSLTCHVRPYSLSELKHIKFKNVVFIVIDIDLSNRQTLNAMEKFLALTNKASIATLFILEDYSRRDIVQLQCLGGDDYITHPVSREKLKKFVSIQMKKSSEKKYDALPPVQMQALKHSLSSFDEMINSAAQGKPLNTQELEKSSQLIIEATTNDHLDTWISTLSSHHNRSFSHSLTACGYFVGFAHELGIKDADLQKVALAGLVHDIGKCKVPTAILDKPAPLTPEEFEEMKNHPVSGRDILLNSSQEWDEDIIDAVHHHHENLDGSGYPDGLKGDQISNMTLLLTITDVFSALTEQRSYKQAMSPERAYEIMCNMVHKFDPGLLSAFEPVAVKSQKRLAA